MLSNFTLIAGDVFYVGPNTISCEIHGIAKSGVECVKMLKYASDGNNMHFLAGNAERIAADLRRNVTSMERIFIVVNRSRMWLDKQPVGFTVCNVRSAKEDRKYMLKETLQVKFFNTLGSYYETMLDKWLGDVKGLRKVFNAMVTQDRPSSLSRKTREAMCTQMLDARPRICENKLEINGKLVYEQMDYMDAVSKNMAEIFVELNVMCRENYSGRNED